MKAIPLALILSAPIGWFLASESRSADPELPKEIALQEQVVLMSAKLKNVTQVQDLIVQQQQLMLEHMDALRKEVAQIQRDRTNAVRHAEVENCLRRLDQLQRQFDQAQETSEQRLCRLVEGMVAAQDRPALPVSTNSYLAYKSDRYQVQNGDTLLKITSRYNDWLDRNKLPRLTVEQIEKANPGLQADRIKVGQTILIPIPEKP